MLYLYNRLNRVYKLYRNDEVLTFKYYLLLEKKDIHISRSEYKYINKLYHKLIESNDPSLIILAHNYLYILVGDEFNNYINKDIDIIKIKKRRG